MPYAFSLYHVTNHKLNYVLNWFILLRRLNGFGGTK